MTDRLKRGIVKSFIGAIALGYLLAVAIEYLVNVFAAPVAGWVSRSTYQYAFLTGHLPQGFSVRDSLPDLVRFVVLLAIWYALLRWLYLKPLKTEATEPGPTSDPGS